MSGAVPPARYVLSSAVLPGPGTYTYRLVTASWAYNWLSDGGYISAVGYPQTADAMHALLGVRPDVSRRLVRLRVGDQALVFRITERLDKVDVRHRDRDWILHHSEIGLLTRTA